VYEIAVWVGGWVWVAGCGWLGVGGWERQRARPRERETATRSERERDCNTPVLPLLDLEVIEEHGEHILRANGLGNITEGVDCRAPDGLFVRLRMGFSVEGSREGEMRGKGTQHARAGGDTGIYI
jgi:hypothetical protein